jgi:hypothetical protein
MLSFLILIPYLASFKNPVKMSEIYLSSAGNTRSPDTLADDDDDGDTNSEFEESNSSFVNDEM